MAFRIVFAVVFFTAFLAGFISRASADKKGGRVSNKEEGGVMLPLRLAGLGMWLGTLVYAVNPKWMAWSAFSLPMVVRWAALGTAVLMVPFMLWTLRTIGKNVSRTVATREGHRLVSSGPYSIVRHPIYTFGFAFFIALTIAAANWFLIGCGTAGLVLILVRLPKEEAMLIERFGDEYREYMKRTGGILPKITF